MGKFANYRWLALLAATLLCQLISSRVPDAPAGLSIDVSQIDRMVLVALPQSCFVMAEGKQGDNSKFNSPSKSSLLSSSQLLPLAAARHGRGGRSMQQTGTIPRTGCCIADSLAEPSYML